MVNSAKHTMPNSKTRRCLQKKVSPGTRGVRECLPKHITATATEEQEPTKGKGVGRDDPLQVADVDTEVLSDGGKSDCDGTEIGQVEKHGRATATLCQLAGWRDTVGVLKLTRLPKCSLDCSPPCGPAGTLASRALWLPG